MLLLLLFALLLQCGMESVAVMASVAEMVAVMGGGVADEVKQRKEKKEQKRKRKKRKRKQTKSQLSHRFFFFLFSGELERPLLQMGIAPVQRLLCPVVKGRSKACLLLSLRWAASL